MNYLILIVVLCSLGACGWAAPDAGHEIVLVEKPFFFGHGGVDQEPIKTGRTLIAVTTDAIEVDMRPQQFAVHLDDFMSSDGVPLDFDTIIRLRIIDSVRLIQNFGQDWYKENVEMDFINRVRQAVRKHGMNETAIESKAIDVIDQEVTAAMEQYIQSSHLPVTLVQVTIGKANPPDSVKHQRIETASQQQRQMTEQQRKLAEDQRRMAEVSRAAADNAYRNAMTLTPAQFIQLETIKMQREVCGANTTTPCTFIVGGNVIPSLTVK